MTWNAYRITDTLYGGLYDHKYHNTFWLSALYGYMATIANAWSNIQSKFSDTEDMLSLSVLRWDNELCYICVCMHIMTYIHLHIYMHQIDHWYFSSFWLVSFEFDL